MVNLLKENLSKHDASISEVTIVYGANRVGDIPHSLASIEKAKRLLNYNPKYSFSQGLEEAVQWYWKHLK
jgi:UDP-N-acetylglucosamine 4-epimerase